MRSVENKGVCDSGYGFDSPQLHQKREIRQPLKLLDFP